MKLNELAYNIKHLAHGGQGDSDDHKLNIRQIKFWINQYRASGIPQFTDFGKNISHNFFQDMGVVPLLDVDKSDSNCPVIPWKCEIKKVVLPKLVHLPEHRNLWIGLIDKQTPIIPDDSNTHFFTVQSRFGGQFHRAYLIGNTLYVTVKEGYEAMEYINIRGVFENPEEVMNYSAAGCTPTVCNLDKEEYPMDSGLYEYVTKSILTTELNMSLQTVNDILNNNQFDGSKIGLQ